MILEKALHFATQAHLFQKRKYTDEEYIVHPVEVKTILEYSGFTNTNLLAAALLHDTIEDTNTTVTKLIETFGYSITAIVLELTEPKHEGNRKLRKELELERIRNISFAGKTIKLADLMSNTVSIAKYDLKFFEVYGREAMDLLLYPLHPDEARINDKRYIELHKSCYRQIIDAHVANKLVIKENW